LKLKYLTSKALKIITLIDDKLLIMEEIYFHQAKSQNVIINNVFLTIIPTIPSHFTRAICMATNNVLA